MCVIAGYIGEKRAAPILLEMLRREEGLAGGFYTGIVTIHDGVLYSEKVVGDVETLIQTTGALDLPGTIGLAHGRTPSGGGRLWGHPFIDSPGKLAYIANGGMAPYGDEVDFDQAAAVLLKRGYTFSSAQEMPVATYPRISDGRCVHFSDIMCQVISAAYEDEPEDPHRLLAAAMKSYQELPGSLVGLCLHTDRPDEIVGVRHNKPMEIGRMNDGSLVIASATLAFPEGCDWEMRLPGLSGVRFSRNGPIEIVPFSKKGLIPIGPCPSAAAIADTIIPWLKETRRQNIVALLDAVVPLWPAGTLNEKDVVIYNLIASLLHEGKVELCTERVPGMENQGTVPRTIVCWR